MPKLRCKVLMVQKWTGVTLLLSMWSAKNGIDQTDHQGGTDLMEIAGVDGLGVMTEGDPPQGMEAMTGDEVALLQDGGDHHLMEVVAMVVVVVVVAVTVTTPLGDATRQQGVEPALHLLSFTERKEVGVLRRETAAQCE